MNKQCTNPSCRKTFSTVHFSGSCPHCGKAYPQIISDPRIEFRALRIMDPGRNIWLIRQIMEIYHLQSIAEARKITDQIPHVVFVLAASEAKQFTQGCKSHCVIFDVQPTKIRVKSILCLNPAKLTPSKKNRPFYNIRILDMNGRKIPAIKLVRSLFETGLKEAKAAMDHVPETVFRMDENEAWAFTQVLAYYGITWTKNATRQRQKSILYPS